MPIDGTGPRSLVTRVVAAIAAMALFPLACARPAVEVSEPARDDAAALMPMPAKYLEECKRLARLRPACPTKVPGVRDVDFKRARASRQGKNLWAFFAEWSAPHAGMTPKNAPPRFAHVNVTVGARSMIVPFPIESVPSDDVPEDRETAFDLGERTWSGRTGRLLLAPPYPIGGIEGDHLIFLWEERGRHHYSLSLHAWEPLRETEATLEAMLASVGRS